MVSEISVHTKEVLVAYKSLYAVCLVGDFVSLYSILHVLTYGNQEITLDPASRLCPWLLLSLTVCLHYCRNKSIMQKKLLVISMTEIILFVMKVRELLNMNQRVVYSMVSSLFFLNFQLKLAETYLGACILGFKHVFEWILYDMLTFRSDFPSVIQILVPLTVGCANIVINFHYSYQSRQELGTATQWLKNSNSQLEVIAEAIPDAMMVLSPTFAVLKCNNKVSQLLPDDGQSTSEVLANLKYIPRRRLAGHSNQPVFNDIQACFSMESGTCHTLRGVCYHDKYLEIEIKKVMWDCEPALIVLLRDMTPIIQLEVTETENRCQLQMLKFLSHELKTPTISILGYIECLAMEYKNKLSHEVKESIAVIETSAKLLLYIIGDILDYTKLLMGEFNLVKSLCNLRTVVKDTCALVARQMADKQLDLVIRIDQFLPAEVYTDPSRLSALLLVLLSNAIKYTPKGKVEVICLLAITNKLKVQVTDTGIGIPRERLLAIRSSLKSQYRPEINKIGLGLCNVLAQALGGSPLEINSTTHVGTSITFEVDVDSTLAFPHAIDSAVTLGKVSEEKWPVFIPPSCCQKPIADLLVVDDNNFNRMALANILKFHGFNFIEASNGLEAVEIVTKLDQVAPVRAVLMDISMPIMNGWEASLKIKELHAGRQISRMPNIIAYSALTGEEDIAKCYESGMVYYLSKPAPSAELVKTLRSFLGI